jgi:hypothetical protein
MSYIDFLQEVAGVQPPSRLKALLMYFAGTLEIVPPQKTEGVHPLVIPIGEDEDGHLYGFLRWPTPPKSLPLPIVRQVHGSLYLMANSTDEMLHRELAWRDASDDELPGALLAASNRDEVLYESGSVAMSGLPLPAYFLLKVGVPTSFFEELIRGHMDRGDETAAMVTAEKACNAAPGWGRPHVMRTKLLIELNKFEEARDSARAALLEPVWSLGSPFEPIARLAGWKEPITSNPYRELVEDETKLPLDRAAHLMDAIAVEGGSWENHRTAIAALYKEAGLDLISSFIDR